MIPPEPTPTSDCPRCIELQRQLDAALARIARLEAQINELVLKLQQNSSNSSLPPSANPLHAPKPPGKPPTGRQPGGQTGHRGHHRVRLPAERVNLIQTYLPEVCTGCQAALPIEPGPNDPQPSWHQVAELPLMAAFLTEHQAHARFCPGCGQLNCATIPAAIRAHVIGPRLAAMMSYLSGRFHLSKRSVREYVEVVCDVPVSLGTVARLTPLAPTLLVVEATGGYELPAVAACQAAGLPVAAVNPRQARDFAKGVGKLAKTDRIDAAVLAHFAEAVRPPARPAEPAERIALDALLTRRKQIIGMRVMETNRLEATSDGVVRSGLQRHIDWLESELADADRRLDEAVRASPAWRERDELLRGIPGIGPVVSRTLLAALPELGTIDPGPAAVLAGLAPFARDSGTMRGPRAIRGGRAEVRRLMYLAALSAARRAGPLKEFADRLRGRGKRAKVVLIAVARKLLTIANAVLRTGKAWDPTPAARR